MYIVPHINIKRIKSIMKHKGVVVELNLSKQFDRAKADGYKGDKDCFLEDTYVRELNGPSHQRFKVKFDRPVSSDEGCGVTRDAVVFTGDEEGLYDGKEVLVMLDHSYNNGVYVWGFYDE